MAAYSTFSDQELLAMVKEGDKSAFTEIYDRYAPKIYYQVNQLLRDSESAKDVVQELFITVWNKANNIKENNNLAGYLYIAAQNSALKFLRKGRLQIDYLDSLTELADNFSTDDGNEYDVELLHSLIKKEIDGLPDKMKVIFEMSRRDDLSYKDIAAELGIAENTVRKQVSNALKIIRTNVDGHGNTALIIILLMQK